MVADGTCYVLHTGGGVGRYPARIGPNPRAGRARRPDAWALGLHRKTDETAETPTRKAAMGSPELDLAADESPLDSSIVRTRHATRAAVANTRSHPIVVSLNLEPCQKCPA